MTNQTMVMHGSLARQYEANNMRPRDIAEAARINDALNNFHSTTRRLPGIESPLHRQVFLEQLFESIHRVKYVERLLVIDISPHRADPTNDLFDPIKAAAHFIMHEEHDEACWMVFIFTHFGKNLRTGYRLAARVYGGMGDGIWNWARISGNPEAFRKWLTKNQARIQSDGIPRHFGNHRKYISLDPNSRGGTGEAFVSYVQWIMRHRSHNGLFEHAESIVGHEPDAVFGCLYRSMLGSVASFARTGVFDYLTMIGKLRLADIEPGTTYMTGATGPLAGAKLLFGGAAAGASPRTIDAWLIELNAAIGVGMQVIEDSLCNWQKSPGRFIRFRG